MACDEELVMAAPRKFTFIRRCDESTWPAFRRVYEEGTTVYEFTGHDYGCTRDDAIGGFETIACTAAPGIGPFFTVPVGLLHDEDGNALEGEYSNPNRPLKKLPDTMA
jgi:hypothetical protein